MNSLKTLGLSIIGGALALGLATAGAHAQSVRIATEGAYAPWNFSNPDGTLAGFELDLAKDLCERMEVTCEVVQQDWAGIIPALQSGQYDAIMAGMNITDQRQEVIDFSRSYAGGPHGFGALKDSPLIALGQSNTRLSLDADEAAVAAFVEEHRDLLAGKIVGVQGSTTNANFLNGYLGDVVEVREYGTTEQHDLDLLAGRLDAIFAAHSALTATQQQDDLRRWRSSGRG